MPTQPVHPIAGRNLSCQGCCRRYTAVFQPAEPFHREGRPPRVTTNTFEALAVGRRFEHSGVQTDPVADRAEQRQGDRHPAVSRSPTAAARIPACNGISVRRFSRSARRRLRRALSQRRRTEPCAPPDSLAAPSASPLRIPPEEPTLGDSPRGILAGDGRSRRAFLPSTHASANFDI